MVKIDSERVILEAKRIVEEIDKRLDGQSDESRALHTFVIAVLVSGFITRLTGMPQEFQRKCIEIAHDIESRVQVFNGETPPGTTGLFLFKKGAAD